MTTISKRMPGGAPRTSGRPRFRALSHRARLQRVNTCACLLQAFGVAHRERRHSCSRRTPPPKGRNVAAPYEPRRLAGEECEQARVAGMIPHAKVIDIFSSSRPHPTRHGMPRYFPTAIQKRRSSPRSGGAFGSGIRGADRHHHSGPTVRADLEFRAPKHHPAKRGPAGDSAFLFTSPRRSPRPRSSPSHRLPAFR